ncbi:hypothetical protein HK26_04115 [Acetobacter okinawensis]|uniref:Uncharacterized protein n=1 Tax=Acetobacter okinawensis TaxID=1076594 RepID=A0A252BYC3_9PROT|nr:hypothetical protein HK26_04115 [Acetobacter okinawensis]
MSAVGNITTREGLIYTLASTLAHADGKYIPTTSVKDGAITRAEIEDWFNTARCIVDGRQTGYMPS